MVFPRLDFYNHLECSTTIGTKSYVYFAPVELSGFVLQIWTSAKSMGLSGEIDAEAPGVLFSLSIYGPDGASGVRDERLINFKWARQLQKSWQSDIFSKEEVLQIMMDLYQVKSFVDDDD